MFDSGGGKEKVRSCDPVESYISLFGQISVFRCRKKRIFICILKQEYCNERKWDFTDILTNHVWSFGVWWFILKRFHSFVFARLLFWTDSCLVGVGDPVIKPPAFQILLGVIFKVCFQMSLNLIGQQFLFYATWLDKLPPPRRSCFCWHLSVCLLAE